MRPADMQLEPASMPSRPNIVVFYIDDVPPHDGRVWSNPDVAPTVNELFVEHGIRFDNAIGENPLCCPARGNFLTGLHSHNNGVITNDARLFNPGHHLATALGDAGYHTVWVGKYLNLPEALSTADWARHFAAWDHLEVTFGSNNRLKTSTGLKYFRGLHATQIAGNRAALHIANAPVNAPLFTVVSLFNMHVPNVAVPQTPERFARCDSIAPWNPPSYNEADVSDKPAHVQALPLHTFTDGWPLQKYCREMLGVDDVVKQVTDALRGAGRLDNTLLVFTADNGSAWGAHRLGAAKRTPYTTPLPLYMSWPAGWGSDPRVIDEHVSNIDLAPTFCAVAGCALGPYPTGQAGPDGMSLVNLIASGTSLGRDALLESSPVGENTIPAWWAVRTTALSPLGLWHYAEYATGERELYDLATDPHELDNLAGQEAYAATQEALRWRLAESRDEGRVGRPDLRVAALPAGEYGPSYRGYNVFNSTAVDRQTVRATGADLGSTQWFLIELENNATAPDSYRLTASVSGFTDASTRIFIDGTDVTAAVTGPGLELSDVPGEAVRYVSVEVVFARRPAFSARHVVRVRARSTLQTERIDVVRMITRR